MAASELLRAVRYVTDAEGERTDVLVPVETWRLLIASWKQMANLIEDREDRAVLDDWLAKRAAGTVDAITLDELERELVADALLPG